MYWFSGENFWWTHEEILQTHEPRYWNAFGYTESFSDSRSMDITCEINFPIKNGTWRVAGAFVKDENGTICIVHSGKIGGGRKGISKRSFMENFMGSEQWVSVERYGKSTAAVLISQLKAPDLVNKIGHFVKEVYRIKDLSPSPKSSLTSTKPDEFNEEFGGLRKPYSAEETKARVIHGPIVSSLKEEISKHGFKVTNDQFRDLYVEKRRTALFEVKSESTRQSRYTAIGQLFYHAKSDDVRIAVFPSINDEFAKILKKCEIVGVTWSEKGNKYTFDNNLDKVLKSL